MPNDLSDPYAGIPASQGFNPADFLTQLGLALSIMGERNPARAVQMYLGVQRMQQQQQLQQHKQMAARQDAAGLRGLSDEIARAMAIEGGSGVAPTGTEGLRPPAQTGFGQPEAFQQAQRPLDPMMLQRLAAISPSVMKMQMDPQIQQYWQNQGLAPHPEQRKADIKRGERQRGAPVIGRTIAPIMGLSIPDAEALAGEVPIEQMAGIAGLPLRQEQNEIRQLMAEARQRDVARLEAIQNLETKMSQLQGANLQARTDNLGARTNYTLGMTPLRQQISEEQLRALQAKAPYVAQLSAANVEAKRAGAAATRARADETTQLLPGKVEGQRKKNAVIGTPKAGKPSELDKDAEIWRTQYLTSDDFADTKPQSGYFGTSYGSTAGESRAEAARKDAMNEPNVTLRRIKMRAWELAFGTPFGAEGGKGGTATQKRVLRFDSQGNLLP